jgi:replication factor C large subunit
MLLVKYAPKSSADIVGNASAIREIKHWLSSWQKGHGLLVHGQPGTGKTSAVRLIAKELGYEILEVSADVAIPAKELAAASAQKSIFSKKKLILVESIDLSTRGISQLVKDSMSPVICTALDAYRIVPAVRKSFRLVKFDKPGEAELARFAAKIRDEENLQINDRQLTQLARMSNGDLRSLVIDIEVTSLGVDTKPGYRNFEENVFNTLKLIFKTTSIDNAKIAVENSEKDADELFGWLEQNIIEEYTDIEAAAKAFDYLSKADIFSARIIKRQSWSLQKYFSDLSVYGTALAKTRPSARFVAYKFPTFRRFNRKVLSKVAVALHTSTSHAAEYVPVIKMLSKKTDICSQLGLDEDEAESLLN